MGICESKETSSSTTTNKKLQTCAFAENIASFFTYIFKSKKQQTCPLTPENIASFANYNECPVRNLGTCDKWRNDRVPEYDVVNAKYLLQKTQKHSPDSLEKVVENLIKTWESEILHKLVPEQIGTIDMKQFSVATNNKTAYNVGEFMEKGSYCCLLEGMKHPVMEMNFDEGTEYFEEKFKTGFAWEVIKVFSGPPKVAFSWRHWAHLDTKSLQEEEDGKGKLLEVFGFVKANTTEDGKLQDVEVFFDQEKFLADLEG